MRIDSSCLCGWLVVVTTSSQVVPGRGWAAEVASAGAGRPRGVDVGIELDVRVDPTLSRAADLHEWVTQEITAILSAEASERPRHGTLQISVGGGFFDYEITATAIRDDDPTRASETWSCECSSDELLASLKEPVSTLAARLQVVEPEVVEPEVMSEPEVTEHVPERARRPLGVAGSIGVGLMGSGAAGMVTGITFLALADRSAEPTGAWAERSQRNYRPPGAALVGVGMGLIVSGIVAYLIRERVGRRSKRRARGSSPMIGFGDRVSTAMNGRF